jgi:hypothetical protein
MSLQIFVVTCVQAREALNRRSWSHPLEHTGEEWWADVLADPRARRVARVAPSRGAITIYAPGRFPLREPDISVVHESPASRPFSPTPGETLRPSE